MIDIHDTQSDKLPVVLTDDYASFFEREEMGYLTSTSHNMLTQASSILQ